MKKDCGPCQFKSVLSDFFYNYLNINNLKERLAILVDTNKKSINIKRIADMKLEKNKLNKLVENSLANRDMNDLKGGDAACCDCGWCYERQIW
ncbi:TIGR04149 family rSAM-modified RiPP [Bacteroides pyogenes]|jgi:natural product precursor|uniref:RSAM-modified peptide n=1 Tax=Bacteroides pyogenes TaxID=310300 RepID=A0A5D3ED77_9BACE|nr:TIGR04149 family rSAM-modified RiPP [Bacteroides pyogenes]TYK34083.1 rSAM-modified peptide [Bacteroides pyogenes]TYK47603.1 rSAM-modified peptide [Bacteroides pyogenes]